MTMPIASSDAGLQGAGLKAAHQALIEERGFLPSVMAARILGVKEATLIHVLIGEEISQLSPDFAGLLNGARKLGKIMALVNNKHMVAMPIGEFSELDIVDNRGHARGGMIDLSFDLFGGLASYAVGGNEGPQSKSLTLIDESNSIVCTFALAKEAQPAVRDNWIKTLDEQLHV